MAWKKGWKAFPKGRSRSWSRPIAKAIRGKANKRYNWVEGLDSTCEVFNLPPQGCIDETGVVRYLLNGTIDPVPAAPAAFTVVPPANPEEDAYASDDVTVVRIVGYILLAPFWVFDAALQAEVAALAVGRQSVHIAAILSNKNYWLRAGLAKDKWIWNRDTLEYDVPTRNPTETEDWTDGKFLRMWQKEMFTGERTAAGTTATTPGSVNGCRVCANTTQAAYNINVNTIVADGTGGAANANAVPAVSTSCQNSNCTLDQVNQFQNFGTFTHQPEKAVRINLSSRRRVRLSGNEGLTCWVNWHQYIDQGPYLNLPYTDQLGVGWSGRAHFKVLLET